MGGGYNEVEILKNTTMSNKMLIDTSYKKIRGVGIIHEQSL